MPAAIIWLTTCEASSIEENVARIVRQAWGTRQPAPDLRHDRQRTLAATDHPGEVQGGRIFDRPELRDRAVAQHRFQPGHVVDGHAVFQRVRTARVGSHVAADSRRALARRVGGKVVAGARQGTRELQIEHARLDHGQGVAKPDLQDPVHPREHDHHAVGRRRATAGQPGAGPAGNHGATLVSADAHDFATPPSLPPASLSCASTSITLPENWRFSPAMPISIAAMRCRSMCTAGKPLRSTETTLRTLTSLSPSSPTPGIFGTPTATRLPLLRPRPRPGLPGVFLTPAIPPGAISTPTEAGTTSPIRAMSGRLPMQQAEILIPWKRKLDVDTGIWLHLGFRLPMGIHSFPVRNVELLRRFRVGMGARHRWMSALVGVARLWR